MIFRMKNREIKMKLYIKNYFPTKHHLLMLQRAVVKNIDVLVRKIDEDPSDIKSLLALTAQYIQEGGTQVILIIIMSCIKCINSVLKRCKILKRLHSKQLFFFHSIVFDGLAIAIQVQKFYPYNAYVYGLLVMVM